MFQSGSKPLGIMIAAPRSGSGKTTVTLGLLRALKRRGLIVHPFKCGPDYIDPAFHKAACGRASYNLDSWAMQPETVRALLTDAEGIGFAVAEAAMGLFDGVASKGGWGNGASADIAALTGFPVVLVLDISGQAQTAAAVAQGFAGFYPGVEIGGVILNRAASPRHERLARAGFDRSQLKVLGVIPRSDSIALPERHLGLVQAGETQGLEAHLNAMADLIERYVDLEKLLDLAVPSKSAADFQKASEFRALAVQANDRLGGPLSPPGQRIALAEDAAFSFIYPHLIRFWRAAGAEILPFSPLADQQPDPSADLVWLPGGYPELHAGQLAANRIFLEGVRSFAARKPVHGECGGYMVLGDGLIDAKGGRHAMLGLLRLETSFAMRKLQLGYRRAELSHDCILGRRGQIVAGHEFHYSAIIAEKGNNLFAVWDAEGTPLASGGLRQENVTGSFFHFIDTWH